jgi:hypothetical protein
MNMYNVFWTTKAKLELKETLNYLISYFTKNEVLKLAKEIEKVELILITNPQSISMDK